ncbi:hypothetical protein NMY22_g10495 [Coprinellus aureogranulatus]|nr:hypothetical protein NMY22_g10495 [Coprinellus aureogranulatus]
MRHPYLSLKLTRFQRCGDVETHYSTLNDIRYSAERDARVPSKFRFSVRWQLSTELCLVQVHQQLTYGIPTASYEEYAAFGTPTANTKQMRISRNTDEAPERTPKVHTWFSLEAVQHVCLAARTSHGTGIFAVSKQ